MIRLGWAVIQPCHTHNLLFNIQSILFTEQQPVGCTIVNR